MCHRFFFPNEEKKLVHMDPKVSTCLARTEVVFVQSTIAIETSRGETTAPLAVAKVAVSFVLFRKQNGLQCPIYYVSKTLSVETKYSLLENLALVLVEVARKLRSYF